VAGNGEPGRHLLEIEDEERGIDRHIENAGGEREPRFLKSPEISKAAADPRVVAAFAGQRAGQFADHEGGRQAPENREKKQNQDAMSVAGAGDDLLSAIGAARDHEKGRSYQRPERELGDIFFGWRDCPRGEGGRKR
jgi:hypothetical protein